MFLKTQIILKTSVRSKSRENVLHCKAISQYSKLILHLECYRMHLKSLFSEHKLGAFICELQESLDLFSHELEGPISLVPSQD